VVQDLQVMVQEQVRQDRVLVAKEIQP
jgi:hypothetical protein